MQGSSNSWWVRQAQASTLTWNKQSMYPCFPTSQCYVVSPFSTPWFHSLLHPRNLSLVQSLLVPADVPVHQWNKHLQEQRLDGQPLEMAQKETSAPGEGSETLTTFENMLAGGTTTTSLRDVSWNLVHQLSPQIY